MTAQKYLMRAWQIDRRIDALTEEQQRLRARLEAGRRPLLTGMPRGGDGSDWTDAIDRLIELDKETSARILELCGIKREVRQTIDRVEDRRFRELLELRYINYHTFDEIAEIMQYDSRWIYELHRQALNAVDTILEGGQVWDT